MFKFLSFSLTALATQYAGAADTAIERSLPIPPTTIVHSFKKPVDSSQFSEKLHLSGPLDSSRLELLKEKRYNEISLCGSTLDTPEDEDDTLIVSPQIFNPFIETLTLMGCKLDERSFVRIGEFKHLKKLDLGSTSITDVSIPYIASLTNLEYLSLSSTRISNTAVPLLLNMRNLRELDISHTKKVNDDVVDILLADTKFKNVRVAFSGMSRPNQRKIKQKYNPTPQFIP